MIEPAVRGAYDGSRSADAVKRGMVVSVFYEVVGNDGVANLVVIETAR